LNNQMGGKGREEFFAESRPALQKEASEAARNLIPAGRREGERLLTKVKGNQTSTQHGNGGRNPSYGEKGEKSKDLRTSPGKQREETK